MPIYEYRCQSCQHEFEILQAMGADANELDCPDCGERRLTRQHSTFAATASRSSSPTACAQPGCNDTGFT